MGGVYPGLSAQVHAGAGKAAVFEKQRHYADFVGGSGAAAVSAGAGISGGAGGARAAAGEGGRLPEPGEAGVVEQLRAAGVGYVLGLTSVLLLLGTAGMYAFENQEPEGPTTYPEAL